MLNILQTISNNIEIIKVEALESIKPQPINPPLKYLNVPYKSHKKELIIKTIINLNSIFLVFLLIKISLACGNIETITVPRRMVTNKSLFVIMKMAGNKIIKRREANVNSK